MSPKRGDRVAPPPAEHEFDLRFADAAAVKGWSDLERQASGNLRRAWDDLRADPRSRANPSRQHRLKGELGEGVWKGVACERWQYEVTGGGRLWYLIDDGSRTVWLVYAGTGHPKPTD
ncbi:hypothetical protein SAMN05216298_3943 [Glycomyces sambucus]|uniref:Type II toxin-antitoxin system RelE/ParE family toxin n=1 Tax=Glycomyces sambucus TaxID=380244 RepID=A0A1G9K9M9_9ACTN|nr:hypothetical protein [Glycomyces sambucus]SDL46610.1 hypothetical protein SAMN05216298_3943 [Glycomyces sambucus]